MAMEIERRFLVSGDGWRQAPGRVLKQGFIAVSRERVVRVRVDGEQGWLTVKAMVTDASRLEFEYPIPLADAEQMLAQVCPAAMEKIRRRVTVGAHVWEVDEFFGDNAGLVLAEVELQDEAEPFERPAWLGAEVTANGRYTNAHLSQHPYSRWPQGHTTQDAHS